MNKNMTKLKDTDRQNERGSKKEKGRIWVTRKVVDREKSVKVGILKKGRTQRQQKVSEGRCIGIEKQANRREVHRY